MEFVYDRNLLDVKSAKEMKVLIQTNGFESLSTTEKETFYAGMKGAFNYTVMNRIESNCSEIAAKIKLSISTKTDWTMGTGPNVDDYSRLVSNIQTIRDSKYVYSDTPQVPSLPLNRYDKLNDIEKILYDVNYLYDVNKAEIYYSGELYDYADYAYYINSLEFPYVGEIYADEEIGVL